MAICIVSNTLAFPPRRPRAVGLAGGVQIHAARGSCPAATWRHHRLSNLDRSSDCWRACHGGVLAR
eukprot:11211662-Lingulodinium_polyedra.AAC.1